MSQIRYSLVPLTGAGTDADPRRPSTAYPYVLVAQVAGKALVKHLVPDALPLGAGDICDVERDQDGIQVDVNAAALNATARTAIKTWLMNNGLPSAWLDSTVSDRRILLRRVVRYLANRADADTMDLREWFTSWDVSDVAVPVYDPPPIPPEPVFVGEIPPPVIA